MASFCETPDLCNYMVLDLLTSWSGDCDTISRSAENFEKVGQNQLSKKRLTKTMITGKPSNTTKRIFSALIALLVWPVLRPAFCFATRRNNFGWFWHCRSCRACWHQEVRTAVKVIPSPLEEHTVTKTAPPPSQQRTILNTESDAYVRSNPWPCYQVIIDLAHIWSPAGQLSDSYEPATDYTHRANITRWWIICKRPHTAPIKIQMSLGTNRKSRHSVPVS